MNDLASWDNFDSSLLDQTDDFVLEKHQNYWWFKWGTGYLTLVDHNGKDIVKQTPDGPIKQTLNGLYIPYNDAPQKLVDIFDKLVEKGTAKLNRVRHSSGAIKEYITFADNSYRVFPLITGVKDTQAMVPLQCYRPFVVDRNGNKVPGPYPDESFNVGIATGKRIKLPRAKDFKASEKISNLNFVAILVVFDILWDNGYVDAQGLPIPLKFDLDYPAAQELYTNVLVKHAMLVERARNLFPNYRALRPWMLGMYLKHNNTFYKRGSKPGQQSDVYEVVAQFPEIASEDYYKKMHVGNVGGKYDKSRVDALMRLIYEIHTINGEAKLLPTGPAMKWAYDTTIANIDRMRKVNPVSDRYPYGPQPSGKQFPCQFIIDYMTKQEKDTSVNNDDAALEESNDDPIITRLMQYKADFTRYKRTDMVDLITATLDQYKNGGMSTMQANGFIKELERAKKEEVEALDAEALPDNPF